MGERTNIEWTDATWNPLRGCTRVSEGCRHCYAELLAARFSKPGLWAHGFAEMTSAGPRWTGRVELLPSRLDLPLRWTEPRKIFVSSTSDLFHESLPDEAIDRVFAVMALAPQHTFQVLTKRPERFERWLKGHDSPPGSYLWAHERISRAMDQPDWIELPRRRSFDRRPSAWPLPNVWLGVSVEDQATADARIPLLLQTPAAVRFVSYEPALGPVDFRRHVATYDCRSGPMCDWRGLSCDVVNETDDEENDKCPSCGGPNVGLIEQDAPRLDWIIVGGESGPGARPFDVAWARSTIAQCRAAGVKCFVKQLGADPREVGGEHLDEWPGLDDVERPARRAGVAPGGGQSWAIPLRDRKGGDWTEWPEDLRVREFPSVTA